jgi:hypothetical protein
MRKLGTLNVVGTLTSVVRATREEVGDVLGEGQFAAYDPAAARIVLREWTKDESSAPRPASATWSDAVHEACHAINWENGLTQILKDALPDWSDEARDKLEERMVRAQAPGWVTAFDGLVALRAKIQKVCK